MPSTNPGITAGGHPTPPTLEIAFRDVMAAVATPVSVITSLRDGLPHGTTVSAFASLSVDPLMVLVSLDRRSTLLGHIQETRSFGVNLLESSQSDIAAGFAKKGGPEKFDGVSWEQNDDLPRLHSTVGWLSCEVAEFVEGGDHVVLFGRVKDASYVGGQPLTYHERRFGTHAPHTPVLGNA